MKLVCWELFCGPESKAFMIGICIAIFNQASASTAVINYAPTLLAQVGVDQDSGGSILLSSLIASMKIVELVRLIIVLISTSHLVHLCVVVVLVVGVDA